MSGWAFLGDVGNLIVKKKPEFDPLKLWFYKTNSMLKSLNDVWKLTERDLTKKGSNMYTQGHDIVS
jgi:hypothetical protein